MQPAGDAREEQHQDDDVQPDVAEDAGLSVASWASAAAWALSMVMEVVVAVIPAMSGYSDMADGVYDVRESRHHDS